MDQAKDYWGRAEQDLLDRWPKGEDGGYETPAFLTDALEAGGEAELLCQMLRSYDIPVLRRYEKDGTLGRWCWASPATACSSMSPPPGWRKPGS